VRRLSNASSEGVQQIEVRGVELAVVDIDPTGGSGRLPPLVWTHGLTNSMAHEDETGLFDWSAVIAAGRRVVRYDVRGHGRSGFTPAPAAYRWEELAADLVALLDRLGIERAVLGGASLGSAVSLHAAPAEQLRDRNAGLVLAIPPTAWTTRAGQARRYQAAAGLIEQRGIGAYIAACRMQPQPAVFTGWLDGLWERLYRSWESEADTCQQRFPAIFLGAADSTLPDDPVLASLDLPTLVLAWSTDPGHPVSTATGLAARLADVALAIDDDAAAVARWPDRVVDFVSRLEG
jgi:3-oxoadipate enol-lactonase